VSLGEIDPPIGFRQFHTIDIGRHGRASSGAIEKIERAVDHIRPKPSTTLEDSAAQRKAAAQGSNRWRLAAGAAVLLVGVAAGVYKWSDQSDGAPTVAIVSAAGQPALAADYANAVATDVASFLSGHGNPAAVLNADDPAVRNADYRFAIGYSGRGSRADTSLAMTARGQQGIVWSGSWSTDEAAAVDLKKQLSFSLSRALLCALEASKGARALRASLLKLYIAGCSGLYRGDEPSEQLAANLSQIVDQRPDFAPAWENLAVLRSLIAESEAEDSGLESPPLRDAAIQAINRTRHLVPGSAKVLFAESNIVNDSLRKLALLDRAIAISPKEAMFFTARSYALQDVGRMQDAIRDSERAMQRDPLSPLTAAVRINAMMYAGMLTNAKDAIAEAYKIWPTNADIRAADLGYSMRYGDARHADQLVSKVLSGFSDEANLTARKVLIARENPTQANVEDALNTWRSVMEGRNHMRAATTHYFLALGTFGKMDEALRLATDPKWSPLIVPQAFFRPEFEKLRDDPRFMAIAAQHGLVRYWKSSGHWPDFCQDSDLPYDCKTEAAKYG
jgi:tetratricopeptide (TPR) repeat protein